MTMLRRISLLGLMFVMCNIFSARVYAEPQQVEMYTYHTHPPFMVDGKSGLTFDLAAFLTKESAGKFKFKVVPTSRPRINHLLKQEAPIVVPWVNPAWFGDKAENRYMWSQRMLMQDVNTILSHRNISLIYFGPESLKGMVFAGVRGHVYSEIDDYIAQGGNLRRVDADSHNRNVDKVLNGYADVTAMPRSLGLYILAHNPQAKDLYMSFIPHSIYERRVLVNFSEGHLRDFIDETLANSKDAWREIVDQYR